MSFRVYPDQKMAYPSLMAALCLRDSYTRGHCDRVCRLAIELGRETSLAAESLDALRIASQLHDVGKIGIRDCILLKPGALTPAEWEKMKSHSALGERIVRSTFLSNGEAVAAIVRHHHEAIDGSGYPDGLAGDAIPEAARILSIVDAYDALTSARSYHGARSHERAMSLLKDEAGRKLDPDYFAAFESVIAGSPERAI